MKQEPRLRTQTKVGQNKRGIYVASQDIRPNPRSQQPDQVQVGS